jgi:hypothetical protein
MAIGCASVDPGGLTVPDGAPDAHEYGTAPSRGPGVRTDVATGSGGAMAADAYQAGTGGARIDAWSSAVPIHDAGRSGAGGGLGGAAGAGGQGHGGMGGGWPYDAQPDTGGTAVSTGGASGGGGMGGGWPYDARAGGDAGTLDSGVADALPLPKCPSKDWAGCPEYNWQVGCVTASYLDDIDGGRVPFRLACAALCGMCSP